MGYPWYTNGDIEIQVKLGNSIPEGFYRGRKPESLETRERKSLSCWTRNAGTDAMEDRNRKISSTKQSKSVEEKLAYSQKLSAALKGKRLGNVPWNKGRTGVQTAWNKGKHPGSNWNIDSATKQFNTRLKNGNFKRFDTSPELEMLDILKSFRYEVCHPYRDIRYPFNCDFYVRDLDLFIECNNHWTHGGKPYNPDDPECIKQLELWQERAKTSRFYQNAIETWTIRDVKKFEFAKKNNLSYLRFYKESSTTIEMVLREEISRIEQSRVDPKQDRSVGTLIEDRTM